MKCKHCGADIVRIATSNGNMVCNAAPVAYRRYGQPNTSVLTPNGETVYCRITGKSEKAHGIGHTLHTCFLPPATGDGVTASEGNDHG
jgi:hypothetical protein